MRILVMEPQQKPAVREIEDTLSALQKVVGGTIQALYPFEEPVALICNDEGKSLGLPMNRALRDEDGQFYDVVCGTFFLCGLSEDGFASLTAKQTEYFGQVFAVPELFLKVNGGLFILPMDRPCLEEV